MRNINFNENRIDLQTEINNKIKDITDILVKNKLLSDYNSYLNCLNNENDKSKMNKINISKIFPVFIKNYTHFRYIDYFLKKANNIIIIKKNIFIKSYFYHYALFYIFINLNKKKFDTDSKKSIIDNIFISMKEYLKLLKILFKSQLLSYDEIINIFKLYIIHITNINNNETDLPSNKKIYFLINLIKYTQKVIKFILNSKNINKSQFIEKIFKEIIFKIFDIINNKNNKEYISLINNFRKDKTLFLLLKILNQNNEYITKETNEKIEENIIQFLVNNFRKEHLNYFYKYIGKILIKFNNLKENKDFFALLKQDFSFLTKINEILIKTINKEKLQLSDKKYKYYCNKGFFFNNKNNTNYGLKIKQVFNNINKKNDNNLCILFTFVINDIINNNDSMNIILSLSDSINNKEILTLYIKGKNLYLRYFSKYLVELKLMENIQCNFYYSFFFFYDKKEIKISINNDDKISSKENKFEIPKEFNIIIGYNDSYNNKSKFSAFNGIIFPIILFYLKDGKNKKDDIYKEIKELILKIRNNYYIIGEEYSFQNDYNTILNYYGLFDEIENRNNVLEIYNKIKNIILYIEPNVIINSFNKRTKSYKDEKLYNDLIDTKKYYQYTYEFNIIPSLETNFIYVFKDNNIVSFFKLNNGINYLILQIEIMYNFILLMKYNNKEEIKYNINDFNLM